MSKPHRYKAYGILNPDDDVWSPRWFDTEREARDHLVEFWRGTSVDPLKGFRIVPVRVTVSAIKPPPHPSQGERSE